ncbi:MAG: lytic transglycosylase domain-containing protein [Burkholderiaceae bacterium]
MQHASHAYRADGASVPGAAARTRIAGGLVAVVGVAALVAMLTGMRSVDPAIERAPAIELRPIAAPILSVMSIDFLTARPANPVPITLGRDSPLGILEVRPLSAEEVNLARFIAQRYRVALSDIENYVRYAFIVADELSLDPVLLLAVMSIESSFNARARSSKGAKGLMQVLARVHADKFAPYGGTEKAYDPLINIRVGARILRDYIAREGSVPGALKSYVGAALLSHDFGYGRKVMREHARLMAAVSPDNVAARPGPAPSRAAVARGSPAKSPVVDDAPEPIAAPDGGLSVDHGSDAAAVDAQVPAAAAGSPVKL